MLTTPKPDKSLLFNLSSLLPAADRLLAATEAFSAGGAD
jgi:hypothetical protein